MSMRAALGAIAAVVAAATVATAARGDQPRSGILEPVGSGVTVVYAVNGLSIRCSVGRAGGEARVGCSARGSGGRALERGFEATIDAKRTAAYRVRHGRPGSLASWREPAGPAVYGTFRRSGQGRVVSVAAGATVGFLGTGVGCTAKRDGTSPGIRCLLHGGEGLPGPCCGPNYTLLVGSYGFFLSARRLQVLHVVGDGVTQVGAGGGSTHSPPYRVVAEWRR